jgi:hypothetical protein
MSGLYICDLTVWDCSKGVPFGTNPEQQKTKPAERSCSQQVEKTNLLYNRFKRRMKQIQKKR